MNSRGGLPRARDLELSRLSPDGRRAHLRVSLPSVREIAELVKGAWKIRLYPSGPHLMEMKFKVSSKVPTGAVKQSSFADVAECQRVLAEKVAVLVSDGWQDTGIGFPKKAAKATSRSKAGAALDAKFGTLAKHTIAELAKSKTDASDERIWRTAIARYGTLKVEAGGDRTENLVHFFAVDGIALDEAHPVVVTRVKASAARKKRWMALLEPCLF